MLVNTQEFRKEALYFEKHGKYDCGEKGTGSYERYWTEQKKRCLYGYSVGGMWITGLHYSYLNFNQIEIVIKKGNSKTGDRVVEFPKFWDVDYTFFMAVNIAKNGVYDSEGYPINNHEDRVKAYKQLPIDIGLKLDERNLEGGNHLFWDKCRGVGASWKGSSIAARQFHHVEKSKTFMVADNEDFLNDDGLFSKFLFHRSFLNKNTAFSVSSLQSDTSGMHFISGYYPPGSNRTPHGFQSEVMAIPMAGNPDKVRGKRGSYILWEEFGNLRKVHKAWDITKHSLEEGGIHYGMNIAFGTGGTVGEASDHMEDFALNPRAYNLLVFENRFDKDLEGMDCSLFTPASYNIQMTDFEGNSDLKKGLEFVESEYEAARLSKSSNKLMQVKAELPLNILDSLMSTTNNKFAVKGLEQWKNKIKSDSTYSAKGIPKILDRDDGKIIASFSPDLKPIIKYPHRKDDNVSGCVVEYEVPYKDDNNQIPEFLYYICVDPYAEDDAEDITSLGAAYVIMNYNNVIDGDVGDRIVASFVGRRKTTLEFSDILFMLAERWNATICIESDRGTIVDDAKLRKKTHLLAPEISLAYDEEVAAKKTSNLRYGLRMGSGKFNSKIMIGDQYLVNWLQQERKTSSRGIVHNFNLIYDIGLLEELTKYKQGQGNYDRISALRVGMFYGRQLIYDANIAKKDTQREGKFKRFNRKKRLNYVA